MKLAFNFVEQLIFTEELKLQLKKKKRIKTTRIDTKCLFVEQLTHITKIYRTAYFYQWKPSCFLRF